jgi:hypothetical protein
MKLNGDRTNLEATEKLTTVSKSEEWAISLQKPSRRAGMKIESSMLQFQSFQSRALGLK